MIASKTPTCGFAFQCKRRTWINGVLKQRSKRQEVTGDWRQLHNTERHTLFSSPDIVLIINPGTRRWVDENMYRTLVGKPERKKERKKEK